MRYLVTLLLLLTIACTPLPTINKEPFTVTVRVQSAQAPLQGATVSCNGRVQITNEKGEAVFPGVPEGMLKVYTRKTGYWDAGITLHRDRKTAVSINLEKR